jgi:hypothetical protein
MIVLGDSVDIIMAKNVPANFVILFDFALSNIFLFSSSLSVLSSLRVLIGGEVCDLDVGLR